MLLIVNNIAPRPKGAAASIEPGRSPIMDDLHFLVGPLHQQPSEVGFKRMSLLYYVTQSA